MRVSQKASEEEYDGGGGAEEERGGRERGGAEEESEGGGEAQEENENEEGGEGEVFVMRAEGETVKGGGSVRALCCPPVLLCGSAVHTRGDRLCVVF